MPSYDYKCPECKEIKTIIHGMMEKPEITCPDCEITAKRIYTVSNISVRHGKDVIRLKEQIKKQADIKSDLKENYGIEKVKPVGRNTLESTYNEIKQTSSFVKEKMQRGEQSSQDKKRKKQKEWLESAHKTKHKKYEKIKEEKAKKAAKDRKITINSRKKK